MLRSISKSVSLLMRLPGRLIIGIVRLYQIFISPLLGPNCRFTPTCSEYFITAVRKYGVIRGSFKGVVRISKCHPWHPGGEDYP